MNSRIASRIMFILMVSVTLFFKFDISVVRTESSIIFVPDNYLTIQEAINNANEGDTIFVRSGVYPENVVVNKSVTVVGEDKSNTIIDGGGIGSTILITANEVAIRNFKVINSGNVYPNSGIFLNTVENSTISDNIVSNNNGHGIFMWGSNNSILNNLVTYNSEPGIRIDGSSSRVIGNIIEHNKEGVFLYVANNIIIEDNKISNNSKSGITPQGGSSDITIRYNQITDNGWHGIFFYASNNSAIERNTIAGNGFGEPFDWIFAGIELNTFSNSSVIAENTIRENKYGVSIATSSQNKFYHNNLIDNIHNAYMYTSDCPNVWDDGYPSGGNYWSDYSGTDQDLDGIGDALYMIDENNQDNYPLVSLWAARTSGVYVNDWFKYGDIITHWSSNDPNSTCPEFLRSFNETEWYQIAIQSVSGTNITFQLMQLFKNSTEENRVYNVDVRTGIGSSPGWIISANLTVGDAIYTSGYFSKWNINDTIVRTYPDGQRETNQVNITIETANVTNYYYQSFNFQWDKSTGTLVEYYVVYSNQYGDYLTEYSFLMRITASNRWVISTGTKGYATIYVSPASVNLTSPPYHAGDKFTVEVRIANYAHVASWQVKLVYDSSLLNVSSASDVSYSPDFIFPMDQCITIPASLKELNVTYRYVVMACATYGAVEYNGTDIGLLTINFTIVKEPSLGKAFSCILWLEPVDTYTLSEFAEENGEKRIDGYYEITSLLPITVPTAVLLYSPSDIKSTSLKLSWSKNVDSDFARYEAYVSLTFGQLGVLARTVANQQITNCVIDSLNPSTTYYLVIRVVNTENVYNNSNQVTATTIPYPVTLNSPSYADITQNSIALSWTQSNDTVFARYEVYQSRSSGSIGSRITSIQSKSARSYVISNLGPSTTYYFTIRVYNTKNTFSDSNQVSAATLSASATPSPPPPGYNLTILAYGVFTISGLAVLGIGIHRLMSRRKHLPPLPKYSPASKPTPAKKPIQTVSQKCPNCGFTNKPDYNFCGKCGLPLGDQDEETKIY